MRQLLLILGLSLLADGEERGELERIGAALRSDLPFVLVVDDVGFFSHLPTALAIRSEIDLATPVMTWGGSAAWFVTEEFADGLILTGGDLAALQGEFERQAKHLADGMRFRWSTEEFDGAALTGLVASKPGGVQRIRFTTVDEFFVIMFETDNGPVGRGLEGIVASIRGGDPDTVERIPLYQSWCRAPGKDGGVFIHVDRSFLGDQEPDLSWWRRGRGLMSFVNIMRAQLCFVQRASVAIRTVDQGQDVNASIDWSADGWFSDVMPHTIRDGPLDLLRFVPPRASTVVAARIDPKGMEAAL